MASPTASQHIMSAPSSSFVPHPPPMADQLDQATQRELALFIEREQSQARIQSSIHQLTSTCWDKCITGSVGNSFSRGEETCLSNCVQRFMDTSLYLVNEIQNKRVSA